MIYRREFFNIVISYFYYSMDLQVSMISLLIFKCLKYIMLHHADQGQVTMILLYSYTYVDMLISILILVIPKYCFKNIPKHNFWLYCRALQ